MIKLHISIFITLQWGCLVIYVKRIQKQHHYFLFVLFYLRHKMMIAIGINSLLAYTSMLDEVSESIECLFVDYKLSIMT